MLAAYPLNAYASPSLAYVAATSHTTACRARELNKLLSKWVPVYAYEFTYRDAPYYFPPSSFPVGAAHDHLRADRQPECACGTYAAGT